MLHRFLIVVWLVALAAAGAAALLTGRGAPDDRRLLWATSGLDHAASGPPLQPEPARRPRPDHAPQGASEDAAPPHGLALFSDYTTTPRTYTSRHVVVHYVTSGRSAPPLNDDDGDEVPDYVERVGEAADAAVDYYARRGFARIRPDTGGPGTRPDLYVSRFAAGTFGVAIPEADAVGGAFAAIANSLDPSPTEALGSLYGTVAHELFHLVQFSYFARDATVDIPAWTLEGSAAAMERRLHPELADIVSTLQLRRWFAAPHRSITSQSYGAQLLWAHLDRRYPRLLPAYLARLAATRVRGEGAAELAATFGRVARRPFAPVFHSFALATAAEHGTALAPVRSLSAGAVSAAVAPLAVHYVRLRLRRGRPATTVRVQPGAPALRATLLYELESETAGEPSEIVRAGRRVLGGGVIVFRIPESARRSPRFTRPLLVLSNGAPTRPAPYRLSVS